MTQNRILAALAAIVLTCIVRAPSAQAGVGACQAVPLAEVRSLITLKPDDIRARPAAASGEGCAWEAFAPGATSDAPPEGGLSLSRRHFDDTSRASAFLRMQVRRTAPARLLRLANAGDEVIAVDASTVVARHGLDVAIIKADQALYDARTRPDWAYRLQALALKAAGGRSLGPADAKVVADPCHLVADQHILALLTLQPSRLEAQANGEECSYKVRDGSGAAGNAGDARLERRYFGSPEAALAYQHDRLRFIASTRVRTADPTDRVVIDPSNPEEITAVHGAYYVRLRLSDETAAAKAHPGWAYRAERTALEAAGASIVGAAEGGADPVVPGPVVKAFDPARTKAGWTPPPHPAPPGAGILEPLAHLLAVLSGWRFYILPALVVIPSLLAALDAKRLRDVGMNGSKTRVVWLILGGVAIGVLNVLFGPGLVTSLIHRIGTDGSAVVTASDLTSTRYNGQYVRAFDVLIRTPDGRPIQSRFRTDDFNVYPSQDLTGYPDVGDRFTVRYLSHFPNDFIILLDDDSPWARGMRCGALEEAAATARRKLDFASDVAAYRQAATAATARLQAAGCQR